MTTKACVMHSIEDLGIEEFTLPAITESQVCVHIGSGGIVDSDLQCLQHGGFGTVRATEPMELGHEVAGTVEAVVANVSRISDRIALNPSCSCGRCKFCQVGEQMNCKEMWFYGCAKRMPHSQGVFRQHVVAEEYQCEPLETKISLREAAFPEQLAVALHAVNQAESLAKKKVSTPGACLIGNLVTDADRHTAALEVIATDLHDAARIRYDPIDLVSSDKGKELVKRLLAIN